MLHLDNNFNFTVNLYAYFLSEKNPHEVAITGISKYESFRQKCKENRILTVTLIYVLEVLCYIKKYKSDLKHNCEIREYNTRRKHDLHTQPCNTSLLQSSVLHMGVRL